MDSISDLLVRIKNAQAAGRATTEAPFSNLKWSVAQLLVREKFLERVERKGTKPKEKIEIILKYQQGEPAISGLKRISRPSQRIYLGSDRLKSVKQG
ncbi:MAG: 30S ribosomal protein S8, partial [Patescibacteria group bacterium]